MADELTIDRRIDLEVEADEATELALTADGWQHWLVDEAEIATAADGVERGRVVDDGIERALRIDERTERSVRFTWWETDDPAGASEVVIRVHPTDGGSRVEIGERRLTTSAKASAAATGGIARWQVRACLLSITCTARSLVRA